jgi:hypothetical protein
VVLQQLGDVLHIPQGLWVQYQVNTLKSVFVTKDDANEIWKNVYECLHLYQNAHYLLCFDAACFKVSYILGPKITF